MIAPARTGREVISKTAVTATLHKNRGMRSREICLVVRLQIIVVRKLIEPRIEETPAMCSEKIAKSTEIPEWKRESESGG